MEGVRNVLKVSELNNRERAYQERIIEKGHTSVEEWEKFRGSRGGSE